MTIYRYMMKEGHFAWKWQKAETIDQVPDGVIRVQALWIRPKRKQRERYGED